MMEWISVEDRLPPLQWSDPDQEGNKYFYPLEVLLLRELPGKEGIRHTISVGDYDTACIPAEWRVWNEFVDGEGYDEIESRLVDDVTHWMPLPKPPKE